jgi:hypothetical protein
MSLTAGWCFGISVLVETSQLYHAPWIDTVRSTFLGAVILGSGFLWSDLACYFVGTAGGLAVDWWGVNRLVGKPVGSRSVG